MRLKVGVELSGVFCNMFNPFKQTHANAAARCAFNNSASVFQRCQYRLHADTTFHVRDVTNNYLFKIVRKQLLVFSFAENVFADLVHLVTNRFAGCTRTGHVLQLLTHPRLRKQISGPLLAVLSNHLLVVSWRNVRSLFPRRPTQPVMCCNFHPFSTQDFFASGPQITRRIQIVSKPW